MNRALYTFAIAALSTAAVLAGWKAWQIYQRPVAPSVIGRSSVDNAVYLHWSDGSTTPDMAEHQKFLMRLAAAEALMQQEDH